ncbi:unnamed protein product, partial [Urochloa humidicola]
LLPPPAAAATPPSGQIRAAGIVPPTDRAPDPRRGVAALERRGPERLETEEGSSSAVVDPPILAPDMDSSVEKGSGSPDPDERPAAGEPKACTECHTTKTPLWRGGPCGPMSLCNACGIRYRKKRREALGLDANKAAAAGEQQPQRKKKAAAVAAAAAASKREKEKEAEADEVTVELRTVGFGKEVVLKQRRRMRRRRRLGEEERAAILLMALSSGIVYA